MEESQESFDRRIFFGGGEVVEISLSGFLLLGQIAGDNVLDRFILLSFHS